MTNTINQENTHIDTLQGDENDHTDFMQNIHGIFFAECEDLLQNLDASLTAVSKGHVDKDVIEIIFHSIHAIHEGAAALGLSSLQKFAAVFDNTLNKMCSGQHELTHRMFQTLLQSSKMLENIFIATRENKPYDQDKAELLVQELKDCIHNLPTNSLLNIEETTPSIEELNFKPVMLDFDFCNTPLTG